MSFATPAAPSSGIKWESVKGALLLIDPLSLEQGIQTVHGPTDAVKANVYVIEGPSAGETFEDCLVFPKLLSAQLRNQVGQRVLGRLGQGSAKPGQSAPWILDAASADDITKAEAWVAQNAKASIQSAAAPF